MPAEDPYELVSEDTWVFDYLTSLEGYAPAGEYLYLWDLTNNSNKLVKIRFHQIAWLQPTVIHFLLFLCLASINLQWKNTK